MYNWVKSKGERRLSPVFIVTGGLLIIIGAFGPK
jgi:hypothetical protein